MDISFDLNKPYSNRDLPNKASKPIAYAVSSTLWGSLDLFTSPEKLCSDQKLFCTELSRKARVIETDVLQKLLLVLCLGIKRSEHSYIRKMSRKFYCHLQFPLSLDKTPYSQTCLVFYVQKNNALPEISCFSVPISGCC